MKKIRGKSTDHKGCLRESLWDSAHTESLLSGKLLECSKVWSDADPPDQHADAFFLIAYKEHEMNSNFRNTFLASTIAALISAPAFAAEGIQYEGESTPGKADMEKPVTEKPMNMEPKMGGKSMGMATKTQARGDNPIYSRSADDLDGTEVVDSAGDKVGTIKRVVLMRDRHSAHAVISTGGMLGLGARDIVVSLDELNAVDDALQLNNTKEQIQARKEYQSEQYVELKGDKPIRAEFSAFEPVENAPEPALLPETPESIQ